MTRRNNLDGKVGLVTGAARRIGARIVQALHRDGASVAIHYRSSADEAHALASALNNDRRDSAIAIQANLSATDAPDDIVSRILDWRGQLDILVNNASSFYPTPLGSIREADWDDLIGSNLKAPLFLSQAALPALRESRGAIVNLIDIHASRPLSNYPLYGSAKAGLAMLTRSLAKDLAPDIRVNGISPGAILWPEDGLSEAAKKSILQQIPLSRAGDPDDIAGAVLYLVRDAGYVTGQILSVDGGRSVGW